MDIRNKMKKSYADICLERAERETSGPALTTFPEQVFYRIDHRGYEFLQYARTDVVELAKRLKKACEALREASYHLSDIPGVDTHEAWKYKGLADELEALPQGDTK